MTDPEQIDALLCGELDAEPAETLQTRLERDAELLDMWLAQKSVHDGLAVLLGDTAADRNVVGSVLAVLRAKPPESLQSDVLRDLRIERSRRRIRLASLVLPLASAAVVAVMIGIHRLGVVRARAKWAAVVVECTGTARIGGVQGRSRSAEAGAPVGGAETVTTPAKATAQLRLADGSTVDLDQETTVRLLPAGGADDLMLECGRAYCRVVRRQDGVRPFSLRTRAGHRVVVLGTVFEIAAGPEESVLTVERGRVRMVAGGATRDVEALQRVVAKGNSISEPSWVPLYALAGWKFTQDVVPPGTILFKEDFERGLDAWEILGRRLEAGRKLEPRPESVAIVEGKGRNDSRGLTISLAANHQCVLLPKKLIRHKNFEISSWLQIGPVGVLYGPIFEIPPSPIGFATPESKPSTQHKPFRPGWVEHRVAVKGTNVYERWFQNGELVKEKQGIVLGDYGPFLRVGLGAHPSGKRKLELLVDDVVIRKLKD
jgi:hypothetical protein